MESGSRSRSASLSLMLISEAICGAESLRASWDQLLRIVQQFRLGITLGGERALVVERFAGEIRISISSPFAEI